MKQQRNALVSELHLEERTLYLFQTYYMQM